MYYRKLLLVIQMVFLLTSFSCKTTSSIGQLAKQVVPDPQRFATEIAKIKALKFDNQRERIIFTGSSSIRFWPNIQTYYPKQQVLNTGFGGSQMSDLLYYLGEAVLRFAPAKVFIYEGDNDVFAKQSIKTIMANTKKVVETIEEKYPNCKIILISAKPSLARWHLKSDYLTLNKEFKAYSAKKSNRGYANVWDTMLDANGEVIKTIFIEDGLHMNKAGYDLWDKIIRPLVD